MTERKTRAELTGLDWLKMAMWYQHNQSAETIFTDVWGPEPRYGGYQQEKIYLICVHGVLGLLGHLDNHNQEKLVEAILERYGDRIGE